MARKKPPEKPGLKDDPELMAAYRKDMQSIRTAQVRELTVADRLTRTVFEQTFVINWPSADGPIPITFRIPTLKEMDRFAFLMAEVPRVASGTDRSRFEALFREFRGMIAEFCQEPSMTPQWWEEGNVPFAYLYQIATEIVFESGQRMVDIKPFRLHTDREGVVDTVQPDGTETTRPV